MKKTALIALALLATSSLALAQGSGGSGSSGGASSGAAGTAGAASGSVPSGTGGIGTAPSGGVGVPGGAGPGEGEAARRDGGAWRHSRGGQGGRREAVPGAVEVRGARVVVRGDAGVVVRVRERAVRGLDLGRAGQRALSGDVRHGGERRRARGPGGRRRSSARLPETYPDPSALVGRLVVCVVNLPPRRIAGFVSEILILGALPADGRIPLLGVDPGAAPGDPVG